MKSCISLVTVLLVVLMGASAEAGWVFGRRTAVCTSGSCQKQPVSTVKTQVVKTKTVTTVSEVSTAQGVANIMARVGRVGHWGGHRWFEGCGSGPTPQAAYNICCFANSGMRTYDVGYAQGANGMWYCCRRYQP
jgi:hypothetical protein